MNEGFRRRRGALGGAAALVGVLGGLALAGCSDSTGPNRFELEAAAARWAAHGPDTYTYVYDQSCECLYTQSVRLTVRDGDVVAAQVLPASSPPIGPVDPELFPTIDELFARLRQSADADPVRFEVEFDPELGYPTSASVDVSEQIADEEYVFHARDLEEL